MQKPVPSFPAVGKTSEVFEGIKPVIIVFTSNLVFKARGPPERSRDSDVADEKTFLVLVQPFSMVMAAVVCLVTNPVFYTSLWMGAVIFPLKQRKLQPWMSSVMPLTL